MTRSITCDGFEERLADWLEGALPTEEREALEAHAAACATCGALAGELREIRAAAAALPVLAPSRDLWGGIAERIEPAVVPFDQARGAERGVERGAARPAHRAPRWGLAAAAAALVIASSGIGYGTAMRRAESRYQAELAARQPARAVAPASPAAPSGDSMSASQAQLAEHAGSGREDSAAEATERAAHAGDRLQAGARFVRGGRSAPAVVTYDREIERLHALVQSRRGELDSATVAVIERNLRVIDGAIAQSRAALARDPRSSFLNEQLTEALDHKVQLLRTAAFLPART